MIVSINLFYFFDRFDYFWHKKTASRKETALVLIATPALAVRDCDNASILIPKDRIPPVPMHVVDD